MVVRLRRIGRGIAVGVVPALVLGMAGVSTADWTLKRVPRADGSGTRCVLESSRESLSDGYQATTALVTIDQRAVAVTSPSTLDAGSGDIGLAVDDGALIPMDGLVGPKTATFDKQHARLVEQFKVGRLVRVQLRFWPEWPATGTHSATFSLIGFTKAYGELSGCP
jgi:hypothetical protein